MVALAFCTGKREPAGAIPRVLHSAVAFPTYCLRIVGGGRGESSILQQLDPSAGQAHIGDYPVGPEEQMVPATTCCSDPPNRASGHLGAHQPCVSLSNAPSQLGEACPQPVAVDGVTSPAVNPIV